MPCKWYDYCTFQASRANKLLVLFFLRWCKLPRLLSRYMNSRLAYDNLEMNGIERITSARQSKLRHDDDLRWTGVVLPRNAMFNLQNGDNAKVRLRGKDPPWIPPTLESVLWADTSPTTSASDRLIPSHCYQSRIWPRVGIPQYLSLILCRRSSWWLMVEFEGITKIMIMSRRLTRYNSLLY